MALDVRSYKSLVSVLEDQAAVVLWDVMMMMMMMIDGQTHELLCDSGAFAERGHYIYARPPLREEVV